jgi:hypothetical protein
MGGFMSTSTYTSIFVGAGIMLLIAIGDMPWGYYELLRWVAVVAGVLLIVRSLKVEKVPGPFWAGYLFYSSFPHSAFHLRKRFGLFLI